MSETLVPATTAALDLRTRRSCGRLGGVGEVGGDGLVGREGAVAFDAVVDDAERAIGCPAVDVHAGRVELLLLQVRVEDAEVRGRVEARAGGLGVGAEVKAWALARSVYGNLPLPKGVEPYTVLRYDMKGLAVSTVPAAAPASAAGKGRSVRPASR